MDTMEQVQRLIRSRAELVSPRDRAYPLRKAEAEGGCGVIGIACSEPLPGRHLLQALIQMRNRGNGKGGGAALVGLEPKAFGVTPEILRDAYLLSLAYLDPSARADVETSHIQPHFEVLHTHRMPRARIPELAVEPPEVVNYFVRVKPGALAAFVDQHHLEGMGQASLEDEFVYRNSHRLNRSYYASLGDKRAFVLSHGKDLLVLKMVGYGDDVIRVYQLDDLTAHVWIGHHRYPTKGRVWHPGGAHPFVGLHEALVHNGDFANYASVTAYLAQRNIQPLFLTDTEVAVLVFDLLHRTYGYPLEYVIEALAPTTERDFTLLPEDKRDVYRMLQTIHIHGSPDGPWFFLIAQSEGNEQGPRTSRLIGVTDTSMLRPQVFALQEGGEGRPSIGFAASEKQAIDAALESLTQEDARFWRRADRVWNARGGSHTDGGAFVFEVLRAADGSSRLICKDKFGRTIDAGDDRPPIGARVALRKGNASRSRAPDLRQRGWFERALRELPAWGYEEGIEFLGQIVAAASDDEGRRAVLESLSLLIDRRYDTGGLRRSSWLGLCDQALEAVFEEIAGAPTPGYASHGSGAELRPAQGKETLVVDARGFPPEGKRSLALEIVRAVRLGYRRIFVHRVSGHRFLANGLGPETQGVHIEVFGSSGDYLGSGIDGAEVIVHGNGQDQLAQIMKAGKLVVHGDVGQTFMYAAKGGEAYVLGNAAGRPLINAVGKPRVVINGTCLDYLAESFMAGDPLGGGGFVVLNGVSLDSRGKVLEMDSPYPGGNLFSLASGGAIFVRDPRRKLGQDQLNGGEFTEFLAAHWDLIRPYLEENERLFGIPVSRLLEVDGVRLPPERVYRAIMPSGHKALQPEEAWVAHGG
jgi:glutamate synthase domain-containing protein 1/glutamate synthase domain-containing protein 3